VTPFSLVKQSENVLFPCSFI